MEPRLKLNTDVGANFVTTKRLFRRADWIPAQSISIGHKVGGRISLENLFLSDSDEWIPIVRGAFVFNCGPTIKTSRVLLRDDNTKKGRAHTFGTKLGRWASPSEITRDHRLKQLRSRRLRD